MTVTLAPDQQAWLEAQVAAGAIPSVEDAVRAAIADVQAVADDDLEWARPYVDAARTSVAAGELIDGHSFIGSLRERAARLRSA